MVGTAEAVLLGDGEDHPAAAVGAMVVHEAERAPAVAIKDEALAEDGHRLGAVLSEVGADGDGVPVAPQQLASRGTGPHPGEALVLLFC